MSYTTKTFVVDQLYDVVDANDMSNNDEHLKDLISEGHNWNATIPPSKSHFFHLQEAVFIGTLNPNSTLAFAPGLYFFNNWTGTGCYFYDFGTNLSRIQTENILEGGQQNGTYQAHSSYTPLFVGLHFSDGTNFKFQSLNSHSRMFVYVTEFKYNH